MHYAHTEKLIIREINYGSQEYQQTVTLRETVLRRPLGLHFSQQQLESEYNQFHFAVFQKEVLLACLILKPVDLQNLQMRQVAVEPNSQGYGLGRALLQFAEQFATQRDYAKIYLHARETAIPFYEKLGYQCTGKPFEEITLPHREMYKYLVD